MSLIPLPRHLPSLPLLLDSIGNPPDADLARWLGLSVRSIRNYKAANHAPKPVMLALFWISEWGMSEVNCYHRNAASRFYALAECRGIVVEMLRARIAWLERHGAARPAAAANDPTFRHTQKSPHMAGLMMLSGAS